MHKFIALPSAERAVILNEAANRLGMSPLIIEKDLWVCWTLQHLFSLPEIADNLIFKGGTSLSKAYGLIERFSEDIDLTISREFLGLDESQAPNMTDISNKERKRRVEALQDRAALTVQTRLLPLLKQVIGDALPQQEWDISVDEHDNQCLLFRYPQALSYNKGVIRHGSLVAQLVTPLIPPSIGGVAVESYIRPSIRLEFGARGGIEPKERKTVTPYAAEVLPDLFAGVNVELTVLKAERTFLEKLTILHALHHADRGKTLKGRMSRHYYDVAMIARNPVAQSALTQPELLQAVVENNRLFFGGNQSIGDTAKIGSLKLLPKPDAIAALKADYQAMQEMFFGEVVGIEELLEGLAELEKRINKT